MEAKNARPTSVTGHWFALDLKLARCALLVYIQSGQKFNCMSQLDQYLSSLIVTQMSALYKADESLFSY